MTEGEAMEPTLEELSLAVRDALHRWYAGEYDASPWTEMFLVAQRLAEQPVPNRDLAVKEVLLEALRTLDRQAGGDAARLLRLRFLDGLTAQEVANRLNLTEDVVYKRQRAALRDLTEAVWQAEEAARAARVARLAARLEFQEPPLLFGVEDKLAGLTALLTAAGPSWLVAVVGMGGIGKTSLADAAVRRVAGSPSFADIAWVSARQERFTLWGGLVEEASRGPALTLEGLTEALIEQFGFHDLAQLPLPQKLTGLRARLKARPYLIVVDNLETAADYHALVPDLRDLANPSRFLFTCRHYLHDHPGVYNLSLDELSAADSLALLRHEASGRGLTDVAAAPDGLLKQVYQVAGGNPLALKLLVGQMYALSLPQVVEDLRQARGQTVEELYRFIYWRSWHLLSDEAQQVLALMPLVAESGGGLEQIAALSGLAAEPLAAALKQLVTLCLVNVRGGVEARRYSIHRLTETFLLNEVLKWQNEECGMRSAECGMIGPSFSASR